jgi:UDP-glucose 4-epimerase
MSTVLVTGASGYIGGQIMLQLADAGHTVIGLDRQELPHHLRDIPSKFIYGDVSWPRCQTHIIEIRPDAIIHCGGTSLVGPSITDPAEYYHNNVVATLSLMDLVRRTMPKTRIIFSSSAAVYGTPATQLHCQETDICKPISPYGQSKLMVEQMLASYHNAYGLDYVAFRYFNACGADPQGRHGQAPGATHIIARVLESIRDQQDFVLNGIDYSTPDGTCVRDYVHVEDIARAHIIALDSKITAGVYNLGSNTGTSNREIIDAAQQVTGNAAIIQLGKPRPGDPPTLTASAAKFGMVAGEWKHHDLEDMIRHAWAWYNV